MTFCIKRNIIERLSLTSRGLMSNGKRQRWPLNLCSFSSNSSLNHIKIEKFLLLFAPNTIFFILLFKELKNRQQNFHFCRLPFDVRPRNVKLNLFNIDGYLQQSWRLQDFKVGSCSLKTKRVMFSGFLWSQSTWFELMQALLLC